MFNNICRNTGRFKPVLVDVSENSPTISIAEVKKKFQEIQKLLF